MLLVDANVLIYAVDRSSARHDAAHAWLTQALSTPGDVVAIPWVVSLAFIRLTTNPRVFRDPLSVDDATSLVEGWLGLPGVVAPEPTSRHLSLVRGLLTSSGTAANLTTDAHLAALCLEYGATMVSFDGDMTRFGIPCLRPGEGG